MDKANEFYHIAEEYCVFVSENEIKEESVQSLMELLMKLYTSAMNLPETEPETSDSSSCSETISVRLSEQIPHCYWEVFDPYVEEEPVCGDLVDDLSDIASDLKKGISEYETGRIGNAVFEWKFGLNSHWGHHVVNALSALHTIRTR